MNNDSLSGLIISNQTFIGSLNKNFAILASITGAIRLLMLKGHGAGWKPLSLCDQIR